METPMSFKTAWPNTPRRAACLALCASTLLAAVPAGAHEIWFAQRSSKLALVYGAGANDLDMVKRLPLITATQGVDAAGEPVRAELRPTDSLVLVDAAPEAVAIAAAMDNGLWTKTRAGVWHHKGRDEVPDAAISGRYYKYATHLVKLPTGPMKPLPGLRFQVVPVGKAFPQKKGDPITVQVLFEGRPVAGAKVYQDSVTDPNGAHAVTGKDGRATLKVRNRGLNVLLAEHASAPENPATTLMTEHVGSLSFMYDPPPE